MINLRLFTFLFVFSTLLHSQTFNITKGKEFEDPYNRNSVTSIDFNETNYYFLRSKNNDENLAVCNFDRKTGAIVYEKSIELKDKEEVDQVFNKNDKLLLFSSLVEKKADKKFYLLRVFDNRTGDMIGDVQVVEEVNTKDDDGGYRNFTITFSPDNKKMLTVLDDKNTKGPRRVIAKLYDASTFKKIWEKQPVENYEKSPIYASDFLIDDVGNFIYLLAYYRPGSSSENDVVYAVCIGSGNNTSVNFVKIPSENKTTSNINLDVFSNELICSGEFIEGNDTPKNRGTLKTTGFFVLSINIKETKLIAQSYNYLSEDLLFKLGYTDKNPLYPTNGIKKENKMFKHFKSFYYGGALYVINIMVMIM